MFKKWEGLNLYREINTRSKSGDLFLWSLGPSYLTFCKNQLTFPLFFQAIFTPNFPRLTTYIEDQRAGQLVRRYEIPRVQFWSVSCGNLLVFIRYLIDSPTYILIIMRTERGLAILQFGSIVVAVYLTSPSTRNIRHPRVCSIFTLRKPGALAPLLPPLPRLEKLQVVKTTNVYACPSLPYLRKI